ncbi:MAG: SDR family NAD(P)-dependent oxidoreductase [Solirubrobacterales bacterium]|nr:SDR family NAD(P)-dependent oxidoreductase [Solirubrobacterales bacterium]
MGDLDATTILITGANTGIGKATARALAARGAELFLACRSAPKTQAAMAEITAATSNDKLHFLPLDLGSLPSVHACADAFLTTGRPLHVLINNAGVAGQRGLTESGFELAFGTNFVGPFLLTQLLLDRLRDSAPARIVNVASDAHSNAKGIDFAAVRQPTKSRTALPEYAVSKLANVLHAQELARRLDGQQVTSYALHPGVIASDIWREIPWPIRRLMKMGMRSTNDGAKTTIYCSTAPELVSESGLYYERSQRKRTGSAATPELGRALFSRAEAWVVG